MIETGTTDFLNFVLPFIFFIILCIVCFVCATKRFKNQKLGKKDSAELIVTSIIVSILLLIDLMFVIQRIPLLVYMQRFN